MGELAFPLAGLLLLFLVVIPLATLTSKAALVLGRRGEVWAVGGPGRYFLLVAPVVVPLSWFVSAALHHAEPGKGNLTCLLEDVSAWSCVEPLLLTAFIVGLASWVSIRRGGRARRAAVMAARVHDPALAARLDALTRRHPSLGRHRKAIAIVAGDGIRTVGLWRVHIELGRHLAERLRDRALFAALLHEIEHARARDPLRVVVASICQALNPLGVLLAPELARWRAGREAACDRAAVRCGGDPLSLAEAIVAAARSSDPEGSAVSLGSGPIDVIRLRVALLLGYSAAPPAGDSARLRARALVLGALALAVLPHWLDAWPLNGLHHAVERPLVASERLP